MSRARVLETKTSSKRITAVYESQSSKPGGFDRLERNLGLPLLNSEVDQDGSPGRILNRPQIVVRESLIDIAKSWKAQSIFGNRPLLPLSRT